MISNINRDSQSHDSDNIICADCGRIAWLLGDVDCNGVINLNDLVSLAQLANGIETDRTKYLDATAGDVDGDGVITTLDVDLLAKYLAGHNVTLGKNASE